MRIRFRDPSRCCHCGTRWSSRWFSPPRGPLLGLVLCADCNCTCGNRGVEHGHCPDAYQYTASTAAEPEPTGPVQPRLFR